MDFTLFKILLAIFLVRDKYHTDHFNHDAAIAYRNAFDLLAYALTNREDCISQFDGYEEATKLLEKYGVHCDPWELEEQYRKDTKNNMTSSL